MSERTRRYPQVEEDGVRLMLRTLGEQEVLDHPEQIELVKKAQNGDIEARNQMIETNMRLVIFVAKKFQGRGVDLEDLIQEGTFGLMSAIEKFDISRSTKFATYATWWIKQSIQRAIDNMSTTIRLPIHVRDAVRKINKAERKLTVALGRGSTAAEIQEAIGMQTEEYNRVKEASRELVRLDAPVGEDGESSLGEIISVAETEAVDAGLMEYLLSNHVNQLMDRAGLNERERKVVELRFGLNEGEAMTLQEVGDAFGLTRERIRQIQEKALRKLTNTIADDERIQEIRAFIEN